MTVELEPKIKLRFRNVGLDEEQIDFIAAHATSDKVVEAISNHVFNLQAAMPSETSPANQIIYIAIKAKSPEVINNIIHYIDTHLEHNSVYRIVEVIASAADVDEAKRLLDLPLKVVPSTEESESVAALREEAKQEERAVA